VDVGLPQNPMAALISGAMYGGMTQGPRRSAEQRLREVLRS